MSKKHKGKKHQRARRASLKLGVVALVALIVWGWAGEWYVHHSRAWIDAQPKCVTTFLGYIGNPLADFTDALGLTGYDTICEYDTEAPVGSILFAGAPVRTNEPAPSDIQILDRGEFLIGWSQKLQHPVWCAYHVPSTCQFPNSNRPAFRKDPSVPASPFPDAYTKSGYDRGHMVPNYAMVTRYGPALQKNTFFMTNIAPQTPALNRGVWREVEHRIANLWSPRYGEIWVVIGCISSTKCPETISGTKIDVPQYYYQILIAQEGMDVRALALLFPQTTSWDEWPARHIVTIREIEQLSGLNFNPDLPSFIQDPLEMDLPSRLWPILPLDIFKLLSVRYSDQ